MSRRQRPIGAFASALWSPEPRSRSHRASWSWTMRPPRARRGSSTPSSATHRGGGDDLPEVNLARPRRRWRGHCLPTFAAGSATERLLPRPSPRSAGSSRPSSPPRARAICRRRALLEAHHGGDFLRFFQERLHLPEELHAVLLHDDGVRPLADFDEALVGRRRQLLEHGPRHPGGTVLVPL